MADPTQAPKDLPDPYPEQSLQWGTFDLSTTAIISQNPALPLIG